MKKIFFSPYICTSGSRLRNIYILVFSIIANSSALSCGKKAQDRDKLRGKKIFAKKPLYTLLFLSVNTCSVIGQLSGPHFIERLAKSFETVRLTQHGCLNPSGTQWRQSKCLPNVFFSTMLYSKLNRRWRFCAFSKKIMHFSGLAKLLNTIAFHSRVQRQFFCNSLTKQRNPSSIQ